jgi:hypothetical protein
MPFWSKYFDPVRSLWLAQSVARSAGSDTVRYAGVTSLGGTGERILDPLKKNVGCSGSRGFWQIFINPLFHPTDRGVFGVLFGTKSLYAVIIYGDTQASLAALKLRRSFPETVVFLGRKIYRMATV